MGKNAWQPNALSKVILVFLSLGAGISFIMALTPNARIPGIIILISCIAGIVATVLIAQKLYRKKTPQVNAYKKKNFKKELEEIREIIQPYIKDITVFTLSDPVKDIAGSQLKSQFGGIPYFEKGEDWPKSNSGDNLDFIFQVFNNGTCNLPLNIKLVQFFYNFELNAWSTEHDGWKVKIYEQLNTDKAITVDKPVSEYPEQLNYCEIEFRPGKSIPSWESIQDYDAYTDIKNILEKIDERTNNGIEIYINVEDEVSDNDNYRSHLGGYAEWVQGSETPQGEDWILLFQIASEEKANLMWGDCGDIYLFYNIKTKETQFIFQCS